MGFPARNLPPESTPWGREVEKRLGGLDKTVTVQGSAVAGLRSQGSATAGQASQHQAHIEDVARRPGRPDVSVEAVPGWTGSGQPTAVLDLSWSAVTVDLNGNPINVDLYRVWVRDPAVSGAEATSSTDTQGLSAQIAEFPVGRERLVSVQARSAAGAWSPLSEEISVTPDAPDGSLLTPDTPIGLSQLGVLVVRWDGLLGGMPVPAQYSHTPVEVSRDGGSTWTDAGVQFERAGDVQVPDVTVGDTVRVRLVAVDTQGTVSAPSESVTVTVEGVDAASFLMAGTIIGNLVKAGAITVNELSPTVGDNLTMTAAGGVTVKVGDMINDARLVYDFTADGAIITAPDSDNSLKLTNERISMFQGQEEVSWWEAQQFHVPQLVAGTAILGRHQFVPYEGGTVIRRVS